MKRVGLVLLALALGAAACAEDPGAVRSREIIQDLVAQEYGRAASRYRQFEEDVLSPGAAPAWRRAVDHQDSTVREWALDALSRIDLPEDVDRLARALTDASRGVRRQALDGLIRMDPARAEEEFRALLEAERPEYVVLGAQGLAELGADGVAPAVLERFLDRRLPAATRGALAGSLGRLGDPVAAEALADVALDSEADVQLRRLAAEALVGLDGAGVRDQIERLVEADDEYVRTLAEEASSLG